MEGLGLGLRRQSSLNGSGGNKRSLASVQGIKTSKQKANKLIPLPKVQSITVGIGCAWKQQELIAVAKVHDKTTSAVTVFFSC